jgi:hypothetical protein
MMNPSFVVRINGDTPMDTEADHGSIYARARARDPLSPTARQPWWTRLEGWPVWRRAWGRR